MPSIHAPMSGVNTKQKTVYGLMSGVNTKMKNGYGLMGGINTKIFNSGYTLGDSVVMGGYNWRVVNVDATSGQAILVCSDNIGEYIRYVSGTATWDLSLSNAAAAGGWLNQTFYNNFSAEEKAKIVSTSLRYHSGGSSWPVVNSAACNVWLLAAEEIFTMGSDSNHVLQWFVGKTAAEIAAFFHGIDVWTRTSYEGNTTSAYFIKGTTGAPSSIVGTTVKLLAPAILVNP